MVIKGKYSVKRCSKYDGCGTCKAYNRERWRLHGSEYRVRTVAATKRLRDKKRVFMQEILGTSCVDCGESRQEALRYHHPNKNPHPLSRKKGGGRIPTIQLTWPAFKEDVMELIVVCGTCHLISHGEETTL